MRRYAMGPKRYGLKVVLEPINCAEEILAWMHVSLEQKEGI